MNRGVKRVLEDIVAPVAGVGFIAGTLISMTRTLQTSEMNENSIALGALSYALLGTYTMLSICSSEHMRQKRERHELVDGLKSSGHEALREAGIRLEQYFKKVSMHYDDYFPFLNDDVADILYRTLHPFEKLIGYFDGKKKDAQSF